MDCDRADAPGLVPARDGRDSSSPATPAERGLAEIRSEILRNVLAEKKAQLTHTTSTTRRRPSVAATRYRDEWVVASDDEGEPVKIQMQRPQINRRASSQAPPTDTSGHGNSLAAKETDALVDRLQKENFDIKLRLCLAQERSTRLERELDETKGSVERTQALEEEHAILQEAHEDLQARFEALEQEREGLVGEQRELLEMNEELVKELEKRDAAVEEAATMIYGLECKVADLEKSLASTRTPTTVPLDSGYYSAEADTDTPGRISRAPKSGLRPSTSVDSDYSSLSSSSSNPPPKPPRPLSRRTRIIVQSDATRPLPTDPPHSRALNSYGSQDSMASPLTNQHQFRMAPRPLPRRLHTHSGSVVAVPVVNPHPPQSNPAHTPTFTPSRPLRSLYNSGELGRQIHSDDPPVPPAFPLPESRSSSFMNDGDAFDGAGQQTLVENPSPTGSDRSPAPWRLRQYPAWPSIGGVAQDFMSNMSDREELDGDGGLAPSTRRGRS